MARSKNRATTEVNAGSMADIAFLLLIFFLVTTTIANDKGITMRLPPPPDPNNPPPEVTKNDKNIFKILANSQDNLLVEDEPWEEDPSALKEEIKKFILNFGNPGPEGLDIYNSLPPGMKTYISINGRSQDSAEDPTEAVVSFKAQRGTSYELYIAVLDAINTAYNEVYGERVGLTAEEFLALDKSNPIQKDLYDRARQGIPRAISIAEPDKVGGR
ncbi:MAG: biopolymer transporter ExbD [bacterium]|nr:biopolymer transporter ExbD [bacterium]